MHALVLMADKVYPNEKHADARFKVIPNPNPNPDPTRIDAQQIVLTLTPTLASIICLSLNTLALPIDHPSARCRVKARVIIS